MDRKSRHSPVLTSSTLQNFTLRGEASPAPPREPVTTGEEHTHTLRPGVKTPLKTPILRPLLLRYLTWGPKPAPVPLRLRSLAVFPPGRSPGLFHAKRMARRRGSRLSCSHSVDVGAEKFPLRLI
ncbi:hypothetical protein AGIG_G21435 [Arapaima gigas]